MKNYDEIISDQNKIGQKYQEEQSNKSEKLADRKWFNKVLGVLVNTITRNEYSVKVTNEKDLEPAIKSVETAIKSIPDTKVVDPRPEIKALLEAVKKLDLIVNVPKVEIPDNKKELLSIEKAVKGIKIPEVKIPQPKEVDFSEVIKQLKSLEKSLVVSQPSNDTKTQDALSAVLGKLESGLNNVVASVNKLDKEIPETEDHSKDIIKGLKEVKSAINGLSFPVSNFSSQGIVDAIVHLESILSGEINVDVDTTGLATEATLAKTVGFDKNSDLTGSITTVGAVTTIVKTDGVKTLTKVIDETDPNAITTSETWS